MLPKFLAPEVFPYRAIEIVRVDQALAPGEVNCVDCGRAFRNRPDETGALCDECCDERDAHTTALEFRLKGGR